MNLPLLGERDVSIELPAVEVLGEASRLRDVISPGVASVVYPDEVKGEHKALPDLLDQIPGVHVRRQSGSGHYATASIRGSAPSQVNIYVDGVPMNLANEVAADISTLPISNVERVEVYRGVVPARFSGAPIGGAINIVTKKPTAFSGSISLGKRSFNGEQYAASLNFPLLGGHMLIGLDADRSEDDFEYEDYAIKGLDSLVFGDGKNCYSWGSCGHPYDTKYPSPTYNGDPTQGTRFPVKRKRQSNSVEKKNGFFKWENERFVAKFALTNLERMLPEAVLYVSRYQEHYQDLPWHTPSMRNKESSQSLQKREALVGWRESFGKLDAAVNLTWLQNDQYFSNYLKYQKPSSSSFMGGAWSSYATTRYGVSGDLAYGFNETGRFPHRAELHAAWYDEKMEGELSNSPAASDFLNQFRREKTDVQLQDTLTIVPLGNLQITPLVRAEKLTGPTLGSFRFVRLKTSGDIGWKTTGSLALKKDFDNGWQVFASKGSYIRYPNFYETYGNGFGLTRRYQSDGTASALYPENGRTVDAGFGWRGRFTEKLSGDFRLTWFQRKTKNSIVLYSTPFAAAYVNGGPAVHRGLELEGGVAWGSRADIQFAVTRQDGHFTGDYSYWGYPASSSTPEKRFPGQTIKVPQIPDIVANVRLNLRFLNNDLTAFVEANRVGRIYYENNAWENPLTTVNLGGSYRFVKTGPGKGARFSFGVNDVFNRGPKQTLGGRYEGFKYQYYSCGLPDGSSLPTDVVFGNTSHPEYMNCLLANFGLPPPGYSYFMTQEEYNFKRNVHYPRAGRTFYATLSWTF
ncbi:MAG: TonB-dependent receptor plug domain-containing protein [Zoogloeaceae bacterium]|nr:TonB-dependent receptor plug domain-containing protein [Zoogloeaceae bacterium]